MAEIIKEAWVETIVTHDLFFAYKNDPNGGFTFPCDKDGIVDLASMAPKGIENFDKCISGEHDVQPGEVRKHVGQIRHPKLLKCHCGTEVELGRFTNTCEKCETDYNSFGQRLADRSQWGEETGETYADLMDL